LHPCLATQLPSAGVSLLLLPRLNPALDVLVFYKLKPRLFEVLPPFVGCQDVGAGNEDELGWSARRAR